MQVVANRSVFLSETADILWLLHLAKYKDFCLRDLQSRLRDSNQCNGEYPLFSLTSIIYGQNTRVEVIYLDIIDNHGA